jgi:hypothetical protein
MVAPDPAVAPVIAPVMVPTVQLKLAGALAVSAMLVAVALHIDAVDAVVTTGVGFTVIVIVKGEPTQPPVVEVGVTIYCTDPAVVLLAFVSTWLIVAPDPALAPVMPIVVAPIVHEKLLGTEAVREILGLVPLHVE